MAGSPEIHELIRSEMKSVLSEMSNKSVRRSRGQPDDDAASMLRDRVVLLEDTLAKSEADRLAVYAKYEQTARALSNANDEKMAMMHEMHDSSQGPISEMTAMLHHARDENERLRHDLSTIESRHAGELTALRASAQEQESELKKLRKIRVKEDALANNVSLADLHYSNERLSAQLAKVQTPPRAPIFDEAKFRECEMAITALTDEVSRLESRIIGMKHEHELEVREFQSLLDRQYQEFNVERAECDRVVGIMAAKLEALKSENALLRDKSSAAPQLATRTSFVGLPSSPSSPSLKKKQSFSSTVN